MSKGKTDLTGRPRTGDKVKGRVIVWVSWPSNNRTPVRQKQEITNGWRSNTYLEKSYLTP